MLQCSPEAFAKCPTRRLCGSHKEATFAEGSECDRFNRQVTEGYMTNGDMFRCMTDEQLAEKLYEEWRRCVEPGNDPATKWCDNNCNEEDCNPEKHKACILRWLRQPAKEVT